MNKRTRQTLLLVLALTGCASPPAVERLGAAIGEAAQQAEPVYVLDSGSYYGSYIYHGAHYDSVWVDLSVRNDAPDKQVGIVWTHDGWKTTATAFAHDK